MAENEPQHLGIPLSKVAEGVAKIVEQYIPLELPIDSKRTRVFIVPKGLLVEAGFSPDSDGDEVDIDFEDLEDLLQKAIDPSMN